MDINTINLLYEKARREPGFKETGEIRFHLDPLCPLGRVHWMNGKIAMHPDTWAEFKENVRSAPLWGGKVG